MTAQLLKMCSKRSRKCDVVPVDDQWVGILDVKIQFSVGGRRGSHSLCLKVTVFGSEHDLTHTDRIHAPMNACETISLGMGPSHASRIACVNTRLPAAWTLERS